MFEFFAATVLPCLTSALHNILIAATGALITWALGKLRTQFA